MSDRDGPPHDELVADFGPGSPVPAAWEWLELVITDGDLAAAWLLTDPNLRLCLAQQIVWETFDRSAGEWVLDQHAWAFAQERPAHDGWPAVQAGVLAFLRATWQGAPPPAEWGAIRPRVIDETHELVAFLPRPPEGQRLPESGEADTYLVLMALRDGRWLVAGFLDEPPTAGLPPVWPTTSTPLDLR